MGSIITVSSTKGGVGKTSLCIVLAANLATRYRVAVIDADRNQSFSAWHSHAYEGSKLEVVSEVDHIRVVDLASSLAATHDVVLVDTAGFENLTAASAIGMADYVLIPCMADRASVRETMRTARQVASLAKAARRDIPSGILLSRWRPRGLSEKAAIDSLSEEGLPMLRTALTDSAEYTKLSFSGSVPTTGKVGIAAEEIIAELVAKGAIPASSRKGERVRAA